MSIFTTRPALRWLVPIGVAVAVIGGGAIARTVIASAEPSLPERSAAQLLVDLETAKLDGLSGTVVQRSDLGIPALPTVAGQGGFDVSTLLAGTHTLRVWYAGPDHARLALLSTLGEADLIRSGRDVWMWDSQRNSASHLRLPPGAKTPQSAAEALPIDPKKAADLALKAIDPTTAVTTAGSAKVAGRSAYELVLKPRDSGSLIGQVRVAIDATEHLPLRVQVYPRGSHTTAFEAAFTSVSFARPDAAQFKFNPPPGTKVTEEPDSTRGGTERGGVEQSRPAIQNSRPTVVGSGWTSVLVARLPEASGSPEGGRAAGQTGSKSPGSAVTDSANAIKALRDKLPKVSGSWGSGRLMSGRLFSVLLTDDGRILVGAVSGERLTTAAADPAAALKANK